MAQELLIGGNEADSILAETPKGVNFYSAGFIYNPLTQQILLSQPEDPINTPESRVVFGGLGKRNENPKDILLRYLETRIGVKARPDHIHFIYDYFNQDKGYHRFVFWVDYNQVKNSPSLKKEEFNWLDIKDLAKFRMNGLAKQDLVFFQREVSYAQRKASSD